MKLGADHRKLNECKDVLVEEDFAGLSALTNTCSQARDAGTVGLWTLKKSTVATNGITNAILCGAMKLCLTVRNELRLVSAELHTFRRKDDGIVSP
jgi:hypothetical protein